MCKSYRPRQAKASPLWQCVKSSLDDFFRAYPKQYRPTLGQLRPELEEVFNRFLRCGDITQGFLRVRCDHCDHEYLLPFTCKQRGVCPTCHQRRTVDTAQTIASEICFAVPHRHWVFTIPRILRNVSRRNPKRLSALCRIVADTLSECLTTSAGIPEGKAGIILGIHTFGDYLAYHPHIHCLSTAGAFDQEGHFCLAENFYLYSYKELFRHKVLQTLRQRNWISERQLNKLLRWKNSGFNIDAGETALAADDIKARERLAQYLLRAPLSLQKMSWNAQTQTVLYRSSRNWNTKRNFELFTGSDFIAALSEHIPPKSFQTIRYYGLYSNRSRGMRKKLSLVDSNQIGAFHTKKALPLMPQRQWRQRIIQVWGYDPLKCPCCSGPMRVVATVDTFQKIRSSLLPIGLWEPFEPTSIRAPRAPPSTVRWMVDSIEGHVIDLESEREPDRMPTAQRYPWPKERFKYEHKEPEQPSVSQETPGVEQLDNGLLLVIEDPDPWAHDTEPVFWTD